MGKSAEGAFWGKAAAPAAGRSEAALSYQTLEAAERAGQTGASCTGPPPELPGLTPWEQSQGSKKAVAQQVWDEKTALEKYNLRT